MISYRRHGRTIKKCTVKLEHQELGDLYAETHDISKTGLFVKCKYLVDKIAIGDAIHARINIENQDKVQSELTVVRLTEDGIGFSHDLPRV